MPITVDREEESVSWNISEFALPSNLNLLYGQTLIYVLQSFGNSGKLRFSYYKNISGVFMILIPTSIKYITIRKYIGGENYANNVEHSQFYLWSRREQFSVFFWSSCLVKTGESPFIMIHQLDSRALLAKRTHRLSSPSNTPSQIPNSCLQIPNTPS